MKYTEQIHAEGLLEIFSQKLPCCSCPSSAMRKRYGVGLWDEESFSPTKAPQCDVCWDFIGGQRWEACPCYNGNQARAAKATWLALESKKYLE